MKPFVIPGWPAPPGVKALVTTRSGGVSTGAYGDFNFGDHVGDDPDAVAANRAMLGSLAGLPAEPVWMRQVHGHRCVDLSAWEQGSDIPEADAAVSTTPGVVCAVLTADCLPVFLCDEAGSVVGVAHAGWRGLLQGVIEKTVEAMAVSGTKLIAWMGPAIGPAAFEVGDDVRGAFIAEDSRSGECFMPFRLGVDDGKWSCDLYRLAIDRLQRVGVKRIHGGGFCTFEDSERFYSYRRDGLTGRMASLIWLDHRV